MVRRRNCERRIRHHKNRLNGAPHGKENHPHRQRCGLPFHRHAGRLQQIHQRCHAVQQGGPGPQLSHAHRGRGKQGRAARNCGPARRGPPDRRRHP